MGFGEFGLDVDHPTTHQHAGNGELILDNCIFYENAMNFSDDGDGFDEEDWALNTMQHNLEATQSPVVNPYSTSSSAPDFRPQNDALTHDIATPPDDGFFTTPVSFIGGVDPNNDWTIGWTTEDRN
jgi:hypothetical protein